MVIKNIMYEQAVSLETIKG